MTVPIIEFLVVVAGITFLSVLWKIFCTPKIEEHEDDARVDKWGEPSADLPRPRTR